MVSSGINVMDIYKQRSDLKQTDVKAILKWVYSQPHLPKINELEVALFLHSCYSSNEITKQCVDTFYTIRTHCPEFFKDIKPKANSIMFRSMCYTPLSRLTRDGNRVLLSWFTHSKIDNFIFNEMITEFDNVVMIMLRQYGPSDGFVIVWDLENLQMGHLTKINLLHLKKFFIYLQEALPVRLKGLHFINVVSFIDKVMFMIKPFLKEELKEYIYFHSDINSMKEYIDLECLPKELGGSLGTKEELQKMSEKTVMDNLDLLDELQTKIVLESKRPGKPKNAGDLFGIEGTFKKLDID